MTTNNQQKLETAKQLASQTLVGMLRTRWRLPPEVAQITQDTVLKSTGSIITKDVDRLKKQFDPKLQVCWLDSPAICKLADNLLLTVRHTENFGSFLLIKIWKEQANG
jgi:hypothetical protein